MISGSYSKAALILAISVGVYYQYAPPFKLLGMVNLFRAPQPLNNFSSCSTVPELKACEKIVLHQPSGKLFLACSVPEGRRHWVPANSLLNSTYRSNEDYVAIYDPPTRKITRLMLEKFDSTRGLSVHGMDVVPSASNPKELFVYMVNHRVPLNGNAKDVGADSVIEIFKTTLSSGKLTHLKTIEHPAIVTPNDVTGFPDGKSFYFTNDHYDKVSWLREYRSFLFPGASVGYCHVDEGCKIVSKNMFSNNGIAHAPNGTIYVASTLGKALRVFERQEDNSIILTDVIPCEAPLDNLAVDSDGIVWAAGFPNGHAMSIHMRNPSLRSPTGAWKFGINTGPSSFYGEKFKVEKVTKPPHCSLAVLTL
ncbi:hypothetical protein PM082_003641 [Marasmius tenuissimus]|nr:hypothetical protein PM082_003641 [Marasmius tenuissimus]